MDFFNTDLMLSFSLTPALIFIISFFLFTLDLISSSFPIVLGGSLDDWFLFFFSKKCIQSYKFPSEPCFSCISQILIVLFSFSFSSYIFIFLEFFSLIHLSFRSVLFDIQVSGNFPAIFLSLISSLIPLWSQSRHYMISLPLNLWKCNTWFRMWSILLNVSYDLRKMCILLSWDEVVYRYS